VEEAREEVNTFVEWCLTDPGGEPIRQGDVHRDLQQFLSENDHALVELPRDHGKSTQVCARVVWELAHDPGLRIKIVCASEALAAERGRFVRELIDKNPRVRIVFPNLAAAQPWTDTRLTVVRPESIIGPSVAATGLAAASTGSRTDLLVCDDIVDVNAMTSRTARQRVKEHFRNNLMNQLEPDGRFWGLCTPWHKDDLNAELKRETAFPVFRRAVGEELEPVWPERWPAEALAARRTQIGAGPFARAYRLVPMTEEDTVIQPAMVQFWTEPIEADQIILSVDPAVSKDPKADRSALVVLAKRDQDVRCLAIKAVQMQAPDLMKLIGSQDLFWEPHAIVFESNGAFEGVADMYTRQAPFGHKVRKWKNTKHKWLRAEELSTAVQAGRFMLQGDGQGGGHPSQKELFDEMTQFPCAEYDDLLDAAATGVSYLISQKEPKVHTP
jgi:phage terminase large subunit-like protein